MNIYKIEYKDTQTGLHKQRIIFAESEEEAIAKLRESGDSEKKNIKVQEK